MESFLTKSNKPALRKKIWIFDIDGTLADFGKEISNDIIELIRDLKEKTNGYIGFCGGGTFEKITWQTKTYTNPGLFDYIFAECGCDYRVWNGSCYQIVQQKNIKSHELFLEINILIKHCLKFLSQVDYNLGGHMIDIRKGLVYISLIGMNATDEERYE